MDLKKCAAIAVLGLALSACQGQNPFKRDSNPVRKYPKVADSIEKGEGAVPFGTKPPADDNSRWACHGPFSVRSNSPDGHTVFSFAEGSNLAYTIQILNRLGDEFEASIAGLPEGAEFKLLRTTSKNAAQYQLSWAPKAGTLGTNPVFRTSVVLSLKSKLVTQRCNTAATETMNIIVEKIKDRPTADVSGLPQTEIKFGKDFKFVVDVKDPQASAAKTPVLSVSFDPVDATVESEKLINGSEAVSCESTPKAFGNKWRFNCSFVSSNLQKNDEEKLLGSGKSAIAVFTVQAKSRSTERLSNVIKSRVKVLFEKVEVPPPAAPSPVTTIQENGVPVTPPAQQAPAAPAAPRELDAQPAQPAQPPQQIQQRPSPAIQPTRPRPRNTNISNTSSLGFAE
jgi:hypothetical protein